MSSRGVYKIKKIRKRRRSDIEKTIIHDKQERENNASQTILSDKNDSLMGIILFFFQN